MPQEYIYIPEKIIDARKKIVPVHRQKKQGGFAASEELEKFVGKLNGYSADMLKAAALSLSAEEVDTLAGYLPYNYYAVSQKKLFEILRHRLDDRSVRVLFRQWQEEFTTPECNAFLREMALSDGPLQRLLQICHIRGDVFAGILDSGQIPIGYDEQLIGGRYSNGEDFEKKLRYFGVAQGSYLDIECKRALLTFCGKTEYFSCSQDNLLDILRTYDRFMLRKFLLNFMDKLSLGELQAYPSLAAYLRQVIGHHNSRTFKAFFEGVSEKEVQKYIDWIHIYKINSYFREDVRSRFWKQFRYQNVLRYPLSNVVVLEFETCVAVEFLGEKPGTIYLCEKEKFAECFYEKLDAMDNEDLQDYFRLHKDQCIEYRNHTGRWQSHISGLLIRRRLAEKIKI